MISNAPKRALKNFRRYAGDPFIFLLRKFAQLSFSPSAFPQALAATTALVMQVRHEKCSANEEKQSAKRRVQPALTTAGGLYD